MVNLIRPGETLAPQQRAALAAQYAVGADDAVAEARQAKPLKDLLLDIIPENPLQEMVGALDGTSKGNGMLAVMFFALAFGLYTYVNPVPTVTGAPNLVRLLTQDCPQVTGGVLNVETDAVKAAEGILAHIERNRQKLGI